MKQAVEQAIEEIRKSFVGQRVDVEADDDGGAFVRVHDLEIGEQYETERSWVAFHITFQYPFADVYPHFCGADVKRKDGAALGEGFSAGAQWKTKSQSEAAIQVSRRSNHWDSSADTAAIKLDKVLTWIRSR
jgi:hypothetical protein